MLALDGRLFLHQQGRTLCRGRVVWLRLSDGYWDLLVAAIDYFHREERCWERRVAEDAYGGRQDGASVERAADGRLDFSSYGIVIHVAPPGAGWDDYEWPALDHYPGGPMRGVWLRQD